MVTPPLPRAACPDAWQPFTWRINGQQIVKRIVSVMKNKMDDQWKLALTLDYTFISTYAYSDCTEYSGISLASTFRWAGGWYLAEFSTEWDKLDLTEAASHSRYLKIFTSTTTLTNSPSLINFLKEFCLLYLRNQTSSNLIKASTFLLDKRSVLMLRRGMVICLNLTDTVLSFKYHHSPKF